MKRGLSGKTRRGAPPEARQRLGLRVLQLTILGLGVFLAVKAVTALASYRSATLGETMFLGAGALLCFGVVLWMGGRAIRGPRPPSIE